MRHAIRHDLTPEQLRGALRKFADTYCERFREYQANATWQGEDRVQVDFKVKGIRLSAALTLEAREIGIQMDVPLPFKLFRSRAVRAIEEEVRPWLDEAAREQS